MSCASSSVLLADAVASILAATRACDEEALLVVSRTLCSSTAYEMKKMDFVVKYPIKGLQYLLVSSVACGLQGVVLVHGCWEKRQIIRK